MTDSRPTAVLLYHYFHPDDVVSARHFTDLGTELARRGWQVEAWPCNRSCHDAAVAYPLRQDGGALSIRRVWRPAWRQASNLGRLLNAAWMLGAWMVRGCLRRWPESSVLVIGTDPIFSVLVAWVVRLVRPRVRIAHWCFDLYPESAVAEGMIRPDGWLARGMRRLLRAAYASCDLVADLGPCMRGRLEAYGHRGRKETLVPWAMAEPGALEAPDPATRRELFGAAPLALLYAGNLGRAHSFAEFLDLARRLRGAGVGFCFGARGSRVLELRGALGAEDGNVSLGAFAPEAELLGRLAAADIHLVSLRPAWTGLVVPSKFFGSLAAGRPVLFAGSRQASIARCIEEHGVGWVLDEGSREAIAAALAALAACPERLAALQRHCHQVYHRYFSRQRIVDEWDRELRGLLASRRVAVVLRGSPGRGAPFLGLHGGDTALANQRTRLPGNARRCQESRAGHIPMGPVPFSLASHPGKETRPAASSAAP